MSKLSKKKVIGITGSMGAGKSQVSKRIQEFYPVIDCDEVNRNLMKKNEQGYNALISLPFVRLDQDKEIDKAYLSSQMFQYKEIKKEVEEILHPLIFSKIKEWIDVQDSCLVFVEMPLLFEINAQSFFDSIWCVTCSKEVALDRLQTYRHIPKEEAICRWNHQMSPKEKIAKSTYVIENNTDLLALYKRVDVLIERECA